MSSHYTRYLVFAVMGLILGSALFAQDFRPANNRKDMNRMLQSLELSEWTEIQPGNIYHLRIELIEDDKEVASRGGNTEPAYAILTIGLPDGFSMDAVHPILFTSVTGNIYAPNAFSMRHYYVQTQKTNWVVVSVDGDCWPKKDTVFWRIAMMDAAIRFLDKKWPVFKEAPIAYGGFSGGAKISVYLAYFSALIGKTPGGLFLGGCNQSPYRDAAKMTRVKSSIVKDTPVFYSLGEADEVSTPREARRVVRRMKNAGFSRQKIAVHRGGHRLIGSHILEALEYFESFFAADE